MNALRNLRISSMQSARSYSTQPKVNLVHLINNNSQPNSNANAAKNPLTSTSRLTPEESWTNYHHQRMRTLEHEEPLSLYTGRTVVVGKYDKNSVTSQADRAWKRLNSTLVRNDVKRELMLRDRYERPHQMRRRLRRERLVTSLA